VTLNKVIAGAVQSSIRFQARLNRIAIWFCPLLGHRHTCISILQGTMEYQVPML